MLCLALHPLWRKLVQGESSRISFWAAEAPGLTTNEVKVLEEGLMGRENGIGYFFCMLVEGWSQTFVWRTGTGTCLVPGSTHHQTQWIWWLYPSVLIFLSGFKMSHSITVLPSINQELSSKPQDLCVRSGYHRLEQR